MKPTRRGFLGASAATPILVSTIQPAARAAPKVVDQQTSAHLKTIMDVMIPASDGMPCASDAGGLDYLERLMQREEAAATDIHKALSTADAFSERAYQKPFGRLEGEQQIAVLKDMEQSTGAVFDLLRAYVYESYYTQPKIWKLIGYELYPTDHMGPHLPPLDESLLESVRKMPKLYRET